jgi:PAS domain S-box-containing protein
MEASEARFRNTITRSADGVLIVDATGIVEYVNPAAESLLGYASDELVGSQFGHPIADTQTAVGVELDVFRRRQDGKRVFVEMRVVGTEWRSDSANGRASHPAWLVLLRDITERKQREREHEAVATVAKALRDATSRAEVLLSSVVAVILDQVLGFVQASGAALATRHPVTNEAVFELGRGDLAHLTGMRLAPGKGATGRVLATGEVYLNNDVRRNPQAVRLDIIGGATAVAIAPLIVNGQTVGALLVSQVGRIHEDEVTLLSAIADMVAGAILRATLHDRNEKAVRRLSAIHNIDLAITGTLDLSVTLDVLLGHTLSQLNVDAAAIFRLSQRSHALDYIAGRGLRTDLITRTRVRLGEGATGTAALERRQIVSLWCGDTPQGADGNGAGQNSHPRTGALEMGGMTVASQASVDSFSAERRAREREQFAAAEALCVCYSVPLIAKGQVKGVLELYHRSPLNPDDEWQSFLDALAVQAAIAIDHAELVDNLRRLNIELTLAYDTTLEGWARALELRDNETQGHTQRVTHMAERLARALGMDEDGLVHLRRGAILHDIGKMVIPDSILKKPGPLTDEEWEIMWRHPVHAYDLLSPILYLRPALDIPYCHHERWDGTGYPRGLKGEQIPLPARIFAVVDVWDALRSDRPYHQAWPVDEVKRHLLAEAGRSFDPVVVKQFIKLLDEETPA